MTTLVRDDFRHTTCPPNSALVFTDPPYNLGKRYGGEVESRPYEYWVHDVLEWSTAPWTLILGPHPTMHDWLHKVPKPYRILYWHRTFVQPYKASDWTHSLTPVLVYRDGGQWYGKTGNQRDQHDCIDAHSSMGDISRIRGLNISLTHPAATGTQFPLKVIPLLTQIVDLVVDPMCGIGSILVAARRLGRMAWGCDTDQQYLRAAYTWLRGEGSYV